MNVFDRVPEGPWKARAEGLWKGACLDAFGERGLMDQNGLSSREDQGGAKPRSPEISKGKENKTEARKLNSDMNYLKPALNFSKSLKEMWLCPDSTLRPIGAVPKRVFYCLSLKWHFDCFLIGNTQDFCPSIHPSINLGRSTWMTLAEASEWHRNTNTHVSRDLLGFRVNDLGLTAHNPLTPRRFASLSVCLFSCHPE